MVPRPADLLPCRLRGIPAVGFGAHVASVEDAGADEEGTEGGVRGADDSDIDFDQAWGCLVCWGCGTRVNGEG